MPLVVPSGLKSAHPVCLPVVDYPIPCFAIRRRVHLDTAAMVRRARPPFVRDKLGDIFVVGEFFPHRCPCPRGKCHRQTAAFLLEYRSAIYRHSGPARELWKFVENWTWTSCDLSMPPFVGRYATQLTLRR